MRLPRSPGHRLLPAAALLLALGTPLLACQPSHAGPSDPVPVLQEAATPLRSTDPAGDRADDLADLQPFGRAVGAATVLSVGEATHSSHEFVTMQHRMFRYLVEHQGFRTFAREVSWSTGIRLNDYVLHGTGDPGQIMADEFDGPFYRVFDTEEFRALVEWMRRYNDDHAGHDDEKIQFMGNDMAFPGPSLFDEVNAYVAAEHPDLSTELARLYDGMRPAPGTNLDEYMSRRLAKPLQERQALADRARAARDLLHDRGPGRDRAAFDWALQHATALAQSFEEYSFDTSTEPGRADAGRYRDQTMADNTAWWHEHQPGKIMVSNMTAHASYEPIDPAFAPETVSHHLRERFGDQLVTAGFTFHHGSFNAGDPTDNHRAFTLGAPRPDQNEHLLDRVAYDDYLVDLRNLAEPARSWVNDARPTRNIGGRFNPERPGAGELDVALGRSYDLLLHLNTITAAELRR